MARNTIFGIPLAGALLGFFLGGILGIVYSVGGFFVDLFTIGLNRGTALAFGALLGMPAIGAILGFTVGLPIACIRLLFLPEKEGQKGGENAGAKM